MNPPTHRHSENRLIVCLARQNPPKNEVESLLAEEIDWKYVLQTAEEHRVIPLLFQNLKSDFAAAIPQSVLIALQKRQQENAKLNFGRTAQLIKLIGELRKIGVPVLAYKGMALAAVAYNDVTLRQFTDVDLLIRKQDFPKVKEAFARINCRPAWSLTAQQEKAVLKYYYEYPFFYGEDNTLIEVHWEFVESFFAFDFDVNELWKRAQIIRLYGKPILTLSAEDSLIILCAHGSKHYWRRLSWICDVARLVENCEINWSLALHRAAETGSLRMIYLGLSLASDLLNAPLPAKIVQTISADFKVKTLAGNLKSRHFDKETEPKKWLEMAGIHLKMRERTRDKIKYSSRLLATKTIDSFLMPMGRPR
jgi:hypothetical protein